MKSVVANKSMHHRIFTPIRNFLSDSRAIGIILIICTIASLIFSNILVTQNAYTGFWLKEVHSPFAFLNLPENNISVINDVLMTFFFFVVGMEIKRELMIGELASVKKSLLPILAALGGMICPALIFFIFNNGSAFQHGWGIPMATDIAFSLAVLSLLGKKVPVQLKIFLAALAIIDDLGAVITIAVFYTAKLNAFYFVIAGVAVIGIILMNVFKVKSPHLYLIPGIILWYSLFNSGVHATIAGVIMAFTMPLNKLAKLEHLLYYPVNFVILPLFALANTAILLPDQFQNVLFSSISYGIIFGLVIGKPVGIFLFSFWGEKMGIASLPSKTGYKQLVGVGMLGGIGFTMSIFTTALAYQANEIQVISKVSIIAASLISGIIGYTFLRNINEPRKVFVQKEAPEFHSYNTEQVMA